MRRARRGADDTRGDRLTAVEHFDVNPLRRDAPGYERLFHVCHEARRPAKVDIGFSRYTDLVEYRSRQVTGGAEILSLIVARSRPAVADIAVAMRERGDQALDFGGEWMMLPIAGPIQPQ